MSTYPLVMWNDNHSYPALSDGYFPGHLTLEQAGMIFRGKNGEEIIIAWEHLVSTYPDSRLVRNGALWVAWTALQYPMLVTMFTLGLIAPRCGFVSVKWRDIDFDKLCVVEFALYPKKTTITSFQALQMAEELDTAIWIARKQYRGDLRTITTPLDLSFMG